MRNEYGRDLSAYFDLFKGRKRLLSDMKTMNHVVDVLVKKGEVIGQYTLPTVMSEGVDVMLWRPEYKNHEGSKPK